MVSAGNPIIVVPDDIGKSFASSPNIGRLRSLGTLVVHDQRASDDGELIAAPAERPACE